MEILPALDSPRVSSKIDAVVSSSRLLATFDRTYYKKNMVSVIIVQFNGGELTRDAVTTFRASNRGDYEIILIDNSSTRREEVSLIRDLGCTIIENEENLGFGRACNQGANVAKGDLLFFLNNDTRTLQDVIHPIELYFSMHPECGVLGVRLLNADGTEQCSTGEFPSILSELKTKYAAGRLNVDKAGPVDWVTGAALIVPKTLFVQIGGFDEQLFMYFEDAELCKRVWNAGFEVHVTPECEIVHLGAVGNADNKLPHIQLEYRKSQLRYYMKHTSVLQQLLLRCYLLLKFGWRWLFGTAEQRVVAKLILPILFV